MENLVNGKTVNLKLSGLNGNAFALLGAFAWQARKEGWTPGEISTVRNAAMDGDYDNLLRVLMAHCESDEMTDE